MLLSLHSSSLGCESQENIGMMERSSPVSKVLLMLREKSHCMIVLNYKYGGHPGVIMSHLMYLVDLFGSLSNRFTIMCHLVKYVLGTRLK